MEKTEKSIEELYSVSPWNYSDEVVKGLLLLENICFHDQTLRDGVQFSGVEFSDDEKIRIAERLSEIGNKRIEAGRITSDPNALRVIKKISEISNNVKTYGFVEMSSEDVKRAHDCGLHGVVLCFPSNDHAIAEKYHLKRNDIIKVAIKMALTANDLGLDVILFGTDASRATPQIYADMMTKIISSAKIDSLTFVDTIGGCSPVAVPHIMKFLMQITDKPWEVHFHNDFGLATANTLMSLVHGASVAHTTIMGIGERSGNAAFQEIVTILTTMFRKNLGLKLEKLYDLCDFVGKAAGLPITSNAPVIGTKTYEIVNGNMLVYYQLPQELAIKYVLPFHWSLVGRPEVSIALSSQCGMEELNLILKHGNRENLTNAEKKKLLEKIKKIAVENKRSLSPEEILIL